MVHVCKYILLRRNPTNLSVYLRDKLQLLECNEVEFDINISDDIPDWYIDIKGDEENNYNTCNFKEINMNNRDILRKFEQEKIRRLIVAIVIDLIGFASYFIPAIGGLMDIIWAPISGTLILILFYRRSKKGLYIKGSIGGTVEELIPATDFIPTALIMWFLVYVKNKETALKLFLESKINDIQQVNNILSNSNIEIE